MNKLLNNKFVDLKNTFIKFPLSIIAIYLLTFISLLIISLDLSGIVINYLVSIIALSILPLLLIETKYSSNSKKKTILYIGTIIVSVVISCLGLSANLNSYKEYLLIKVTSVYLIFCIITFLYLNFKQSKKNIFEYMRSTFINIFSNLLIYFIVAISLLVLTMILTCLILDFKMFKIIPDVQILILGLYFIPLFLISFSKNNEGTKFSKNIIVNVLGSLLIISYIVVYTYAFKVIITKDIMSNGLFITLTWIFICSIIICNLIASYKEDNLISKICNKLPLVFIIGIIIQIIIIGIRVAKYSLTVSRYIAIMLIIVESIYIFIYLKNKEKSYYMLWVIAIISTLSLIAPFINMDTLSNYSQYVRMEHLLQNKCISINACENKDEIISVYQYLKYSNDKRYYNKLSQNDIEYLENSNYNSIDDYYDTDDNIEYLYATKRIENINVLDYKTIYLFADNIEEVDIDEEKKEIIKSAILEKINIYMDNCDNINEFFDKNNIIDLDNYKIILTEVSIDFDNENYEISSQHISGYILEK